MRSEGRHQTKIRKHRRKDALNDLPESLLRAPDASANSGQIFVDFWREPLALPGGYTQIDDHAGQVGHCVVVQLFSQSLAFLLLAGHQGAGRKPLGIDQLFLCLFDVPVRCKKVGVGAQELVLLRRYGPPPPPRDPNKARVEDDKPASDGDVDRPAKKIEIGVEVDETGIYLDRILFNPNPPKEGVGLAS